MHPSDVTQIAESQLFIAVEDIKDASTLQELEEAKTYAEDALEAIVNSCKAKFE